MTRWSPVLHRHDLYLKIRDLAEELLALADEWRDHDPELCEIDIALEGEAGDLVTEIEPLVEPDDDIPW